MISTVPIVPTLKHTKKERMSLSAKLEPMQSGTGPTTTIFNTTPQVPVHRT